MKLSERENPSEGATIRTLIVDDSRLVRATLIEFLGSLPRIEVVGTAADGREALALLIDRKPDLVVMDLHMPSVDGLQALRRIRERHPETRVVMMTMSSGAEARARCLEAGADAFISKDDLRRELKRAIARLFPTRPTSGNSPAPKRDRS